MTIHISYNPLVWQEGLTTPDGVELTVEQFNVAREAAKDSTLNIIRNHRNKLLQECDWTQTPDNPLPSEQKASWAAYRQELRDFPETLNMDEPFILTDSGFPQKPQ